MSISPIASSIANLPNVQASSIPVRPDSVGGNTIDVKAGPVPPNAPASTVATTSAVQRSADDAKLEQAVAALNKFLKPIASSIEFSIDQDSGRTLVKVIDTDTNDVLRQFPSKEALAISESLDRFQGLLIREKA